MSQKFEVDEEVYDQLVTLYSCIDKELQKEFESTCEQFYHNKRTTSMYDVQENKVISFDFCIWCMKKL